MINKGIFAEKSYGNRKGGGAGSCQILNMRQIQENVAKDTNPCTWLSLTSSKHLTYPLGVPFLILLHGEIHILRLFHDDSISMEAAQSLSLSDVRKALFHPPFLPSSLQRSCITYARITTRDQNRLQHGSKMSARHPYAVSSSSSMQVTTESLQKKRTTSSKSLLLSISHTQSWD